MNGNGGHSTGGAIAALFFAIGALLLFAVGFAFFLILPFFIFLIGIIAMIVSDRKSDDGPPERVREEEVVVTETEVKRVEVAK